MHRVDFFLLLFMIIAVILAVVPNRHCWRCCWYDDDGFSSAFLRDGCPCQPLLQLQRCRPPGGLCTAPAAKPGRLAKRPTTTSWTSFWTTAAGLALMGLPCVEIAFDQGPKPHTCIWYVCMHTMPIIDPRLHAYSSRNLREGKTTLKSSLVPLLKCSRSLQCIIPASIPCSVLLSTTKPFVLPSYPVELSNAFFIRTLQNWEFLEFPTPGCEEA